MIAAVYPGGQGLRESRGGAIQVVEGNYEGMVGKDEASPYREGRTLSWLKVKVPKYREGERGWEPK